jgi:hypothetical protein
MTTQLEDCHRLSSDILKNLGLCSVTKHRLGKNCCKTENISMKMFGSSCMENGLVSIICMYCNRIGAFTSL